VVTHRVYFWAAGAVVALLSLVWAIVSWRRHVARVRPPTATATAKPQARSGSAPAQTRRARMMERMEERWRRRQEGGRM